MTADQEGAGHESEPSPEAVAVLAPSAIVIRGSPRDQPGRAVVRNLMGMIMVGPHLQAAREKQTEDTEREDARDRDGAVPPPSKEKRPGCKE
ncbi:MAG TPA: hypothetical protein RMG48_02775 [Myxococcales bacterium LLY-WYZ-16_1]|nr:hypothetical protein [Myxococcales bacterium LLY-WYZ-16_1]